MPTYTHSSKLPEALEYNDKIFFILPNKRLIYRVKEVSVESCGFFTNSEIFDILQIINKNKFASKYYKYLPINGSWPWYKYNDYNSASKLVKVLMEMCENLVEEHQQNK